MEFRRKAWVPKVPVLTPTTVAELVDMSFRRNVVALWQYVQWLFEAHGWKVVGAALLFYLGRQRYREFAARRHHQRTLAG
ncbi:hypothetical protein JG688_00001973 [Phytophthora aleatoria]|uniref:Uncharacterized protein n=1 Tax=Phytophthora aleatoria TaxID=2496075 RepID=A0A8J5J5C9_9STRA|nr:hypothetical protein JG688_00001973 [Phytophthora aleatoria]